MSKRGIQIKFDEFGEPQVDRDAVEKDECIGGVWCEHADTEEKGEGILLLCRYIEDGNQNVFLIDECPLERWGKIDYSGSVIDNKMPIYQRPENACAMCATTTMWQLKSNKTDHWVCFNCHPPAPGIKKGQIIKREYKDIK